MGGGPIVPLIVRELGGGPILPLIGLELGGSGGFDAAKKNHYTFSPRIPKINTKQTDGRTMEDFKIRQLRFRLMKVKLSAQTQRIQSYSFSSVGQIETDREMYPKECL